MERRASAEGALVDGAEGPGSLRVGMLDLLHQYGGGTFPGMLKIALQQTD